MSQRKAKMRGYYYLHAPGDDASTLCGMNGVLSHPRRANCPRCLMLLKKAEINPESQPGETPPPPTEAPKTPPK